MKVSKWPAFALAFFLALALLPWQVQAQTETVPQSPAHSLACLKRPAQPPRYPARYANERTSGFMRVRLQFERPDAAPKVEVLANTARQDMQDLVFDYLSDYRLPCLSDSDGQVAVVQEFRFSNSILDSPPIAELVDKDRPLCVVLPRTDPNPPSSLSRNIENVVLAFVFQGDGAEAPEVRIIHSTGDRRFEEMAVERVREYRMPCRKAGEPTRVFQQTFRYVPATSKSYTFNREVLGLAEFLSLVKGVQTLKADFDFGTMKCPFNVRFEALAPALPNGVQSIGRPDANRQLFLHWLSQLQIDFKNETQARALFGSVLMIQVPCGSLRLGEESQ